MTHDDAFLQAIIDAPEDDTPRLVYADWLDDHGQPERAEFIRVQIEAARMEEDDPRRPGLLGREDELLKNYGERWLEPLRQHIARPRSFGGRLWELLFPRSRPTLPWYVERRVSFHRGFVQYLSVTPAELLTHADDLFRAVPVLVDLLVVIESPEDAASLFDSPHLARLRGLALYDDVLGPQVVERLVSSPHLGKLKRLWLHSPLLDTGCVRLLADAALLGQLTDLAFYTRRYLGQSEWARGTLGDDAVRILAGSPRCGNLEALDLDHNPVSDLGAAALAASPHLGQVRYLTLQGTDISQEGMERLKARFGNRVHF